MIHRVIAIAHHTVHIRHIRWIVERPDWPQEAATTVAYLWRAGPRLGINGLRVLFLRVTHGGGRSGRVRTFVADRWLDDHVHGHIHLHG